MKQFRLLMMGFILVALSGCGIEEAGFVLIEVIIT